jgi:hypothetical protein
MAQKNLSRYNRGSNKSHQSRSANLAEGGLALRSRLVQTTPIPEVQIQKHDFIVRDEGTIWLFTPLSESASEFLREHIQEDAQYFGTSLCCEHRFARDLLAGLREHGLSAVAG